MRPSKMSARKENENKGGAPGDAGGEAAPLLGEAGVDSRGSAYNTMLFCLLTAFLFADTNLMAPNLTQIADEFGMSPQERDEKLGGGIALAFFLIGAPAALAIGWYADALPRKGMFCAVLFLGQAPALLTLWAASYWELFVLRALTGVAIAGVLPLMCGPATDAPRAARRAPRPGARAPARHAPARHGGAARGGCAGTRCWRTRTARASVCASPPSSRSPCRPASPPRQARQIRTAAAGGGRRAAGGGRR
jgi:hypothetical protein